MQATVLNATQTPYSLLPPALFHRLLLSFILISNSFSVLAQNAPHPSFRQYTTDDGLASSETYQVLQDREGYIWIATDNGVSRFDGYNFRNYGVKDGLLENVIFMMQLDSLGRIWMQAMSGNLYYLESDTILPYWYNKVLLDFKGRLDVVKGFIVEGAGETVHIATFKYGVISISQDGKSTTSPCKEGICWQVFEKKGIVITGMAENPDLKTAGPYWEEMFRKNHSPPVYLNIQDGKYVFTDLFYSKKTAPTTELFRLTEGEYLLKIYSDVWFIEKGKIQWQVYFPYIIDHTQLMEDGKLYVGLFDHQGLKIYDSIEAFRQGNGQTWMNGQSVSNFMEDREGGKWFATNDGGVFYASADAFMVHDLESGLPDEKVTALTIKNSQELYVGLGNGEVWHLDQITGKWTALPEILETGYIRDLYFDPFHQQLWAGLVGLFYLQDNNWHPSGPYLNGKLISISDHMTQSPNGERLWLSNFRGFMSMQVPELLPANLHRGYDQRTYVVLEDFAGRVWMGRPQGLFELQGDTVTSRQNIHPAFSLRVQDIALMPDSTLVIATKGGGVVFWKGDQFEQLTTEQGLTADMLECLHADANGVLWAGTLNGLNRITGTWGNRQVEQITVFHGLPSNEINRVCTFGENVWVATSRGLVHFSNKKKSLFSPQPFMASVLANKRELDLKKPLVLNSKENNLSISFSAINYKMNGKIPYRYRMDSGDWTQTLNRSLDFPALSPGDRCFEVQAQNEDGFWSESASLHFVIKPPWWGTWWARTAGLLLILALGWSAYKYRTGQLKKENQIQRQISDLERSALQAQMNPHFIFNCLNSIQHYILKNEKESAILYLGNFASLVRSMLNASVSGKILLVEEVKLLNNYLALENLRFKNRFTYEVSTADNLDVYEVKIPPLLVQPYVENAIIHGISGRETGGKVTVFFEKKEDYLEVSILDNGTGLATNNGQSTKPKDHKSFGMSITRNRLELLSKKKEDQAVKTRTLFDENNQPCGTEVQIKIGLKDEFIKGFQDKI